MARVITPESARFYDMNARVVLSVPKVSGVGTKDPTITDARKNHYMPSTTCVIKGLAAPGLDVWKIEHAIRTSINTERLEGEAEDALVKRINELSLEFAKTAADRGGEIHGQLYQAFSDDKTPEDPAAQIAFERIRLFIKDWQGSDEITIMVEAPFANLNLGWAGRIDLCCFAQGPGGVRHMVMDYKTTNLEKYAGPFYNNGLQLGGYRLGRGFPEDSELVNAIVDATTGETKFFKWGEKGTKHDPLTLSKGFAFLFEGWCCCNNYDPRKYVTT